MYVLCLKVSQRANARLLSAAALASRPLLGRRLALSPPPRRLNAFRGAAAAAAGAAAAAAGEGAAVTAVTSALSLSLSRCQGPGPLCSFVRLESSGPSESESRSGRDRHAARTAAGDRAHDSAGWTCCRVPPVYRATGECPLTATAAKPRRAAAELAGTHTAVGAAGRTGAPPRSRGTAAASSASSGGGCGCRPHDIVYCCLAPMICCTMLNAAAPWSAGTMCPAFKMWNRLRPGVTVAKPAVLTVSPPA